MPDYGARIADKAIAQTARKVRDVYKQAALEIRKKMDDFTKRHIAKNAEMLGKLQAGDITKSAYDTWMRGQVFIGKQWDMKLDQAMKIMDDANREAVKIVNERKLDVFAENYNYAAYELEQKAAVSFNIYNDKTVAKLLKENPKMLPEWKIDQRKDYAWNRQKVENCITQGIIQGEGIDQITDRLVGSLITQNENRMRTFARTAVTGAQNAGRQAQMEDAEDMGIKSKKRWLATLDDRTRDTHQRLDGQEVEVDEPFKVDGMEIMYPGDPSADAELVYNCRCTMIQIFEGVNRHSTRRAYDEDEDGNRSSYLVEDMTYTEWKEWKENGKQSVEDDKPSEKTEEEKHIEDIFNLMTNQDNQSNVDDDFDIFDYLGEDEGESHIEEEPQGIKDSDEYGDFGMTNESYPDELRYTEEEQKEVDNIYKYYQDEAPRGFDPSSDVMDALVPAKDIEHNEWKQEALDKKIDLNRQKKEEAEKMIEQRKAEGYKGMSKEESAMRWRALKSALEEAGGDEVERGDILSSAQVGENGIQYWQRKRKAAERNEGTLAFAQKIISRERYALEHGKTGWKKR